MAFTLKPAIGDEFFDRTELISEMVNTLSEPKLRMGFALVGSRRVGKTSILMEVERLLKGKKGIVPVYFSLWELVERTVQEFIFVLTQEIIEAYKKELSWKYKIRNVMALPVSTVISILKATDLKIKLFDEIELLLSQKGIRKEYIAQVVKETFTLPEQLAEKTNTRCVLILDEFPLLMDLKNGRKLGEGIIGAIRTANETYRNTILTVSGSIRATMEMAVLSSSSPFYRQFIVKNISPFQKEDVLGLLKANLDAIIDDKALAYLYKETGGIPFYIQFIGRKLFQKRVQKISLTRVKDCLVEFIDEEGNLIFSEEFERIGSKERLVLSILARSDSQNLSSIAKTARESMNAVSRYLNYLIKRGMVRKKERGLYQIVDPMFKRWIMQKREGITSVWK